MQYTVRPGDNLYAIAARFGVPVQTIMVANHITNPLQLFAGQTLYIPVGQGGPVPAPGPGYPPPGIGVGGNVAQRVERLERQVERQQREINELERRVRRLERP
ncbi:hypothetical protein CBW65_02535 [Tumebacillus avium]|uniref:LysM domain-containing protein n=1 Tax=Tumebacillus avium TaxID=1903704 RepID=A0A1Y0IKL8_9BACL|nr:LysM peptidoglycan-binding domain-containing protein [Tumebacillus avium]ARU60065.1 hypothetical protein CBW65_02535 [Tumebacillus avium]